jgi:hypothetical protein
MTERVWIRTLVTLTAVGSTGLVVLALDALF